MSGPPSRLSLFGLLLCTVPTANPLPIGTGTVQVLTLVRKSVLLLWGFPLQPH